MTMKEVRAVRHEWLDRSISWYIQIDEETYGGEMFGQDSAEKSAKALADNIKGKYIGIVETKEMFA